MKVKIKNAIIFMLFISATIIFSQTTPSVNLLNLHSTRNMRSTSAPFGPFNYNYVRLQSDRTLDSVLIHAIRIEFRPDSVINTTGNGLFMRADTTAHIAATNRITDSLGIPRMPLSRTDRREFEWYATGTYRFDNLPHDSIYFDYHLKSLRNYFLEASNGNVRIGHRIFPSGAFGAYRLDREMARFSPGLKRRDETYDEFNMRLARELMRFVSQSIMRANHHAETPFAGLRIDNSNGMVVNQDNIPVFFLLIHAGSSALTDNDNDSPSDLTASFIGEELFRYFNLPHENIFVDSVFGRLVETREVAGRTRTGANVSTGNDTIIREIIIRDSIGDIITDTIIIDTIIRENFILVNELMMVSETANQDGLNWGINGILVNQFARQIGIPDLFSTMSGTTGIGGFCIMDFAGYSGAQGFIPPRPSAFVRSFMGWEPPTLATDTNRLTVGGNNLILVPINSTEYYLIENRQRNLVRDVAGNQVRNLFVFDPNNPDFIQAGFHVELANNVDSVSNRRRVIMSVKSRDIGIPASGALVWHIDEKLIRNRLELNMLNSDSADMAVRLVEADGVRDIGIQFSDIFGGASWDYGTAGDVFPHTNIFDREANRPSFVINTMSPTTAPATTANDGGNTFLTLQFRNAGDTNRLPREEYRSHRGSGRFQNYTIKNFSDSTIILTITHENDTNFLSPHPEFPVRVAGRGFFPLLTADFFNENDIIALSKDGFLSIVSQDGVLNPYAPIKIENPVNMPSFIGRNLFVPALNRLLIYRSVFDGNAGRSIQPREISVNVSTYVVGLTENSWVFGTSDGHLMFGSNDDTTHRVSASNRAISAIAKFDDGRVAAVDESGTVFIATRNEMIRPEDRFSLPRNNQSIFAPFKIAVSGNNIFVADNRQGLWFLIYCEDDEKIKLHENWRGRREQAQLPIDWAGTFREQTGRENIPVNHGFLSMANLAARGELHLLLGGTNGIWAFDEKGNLLENYPAVLDRAEWWIRESVLSTPTTARTRNNETMVFFTTTTGDTRNVYQAKITRADLDRRIIWFNNFHGNPDSLIGLSRAFIDTLLTMSDSTILLNFAPGGLIDIRDGRTGRRPDLTVSNLLTGNRRIYPYLTSIGDPLSQGVVIAPSGNTLFITVISDNGMLHRFGLPPRFPADESNIDMTGGNAMRQFNFAPLDNSSQQSGNTLEYFYSYPNPVRIQRGQNGSATFRYRLGANATSVRLTIYTIQGQRIFDDRNLRSTKGVNEFVLNNITFGSAVYRARLSVMFGNEERVLFWKMAVLR